jgi:hypothetical protein
MFACAYRDLNVLSNDARRQNVLFPSAATIRQLPTSNMGDEDVEITGTERNTEERRKVRDG